jgi:hypothetical protein
MASRAVGRVISGSQKGAGIVGACPQMQQNPVRVATRKRTIFEQKFQSEDLPDSFNFSSITPLQLDDYLERLLDERAAISEYLAYLRLCHRGAVAILKGESDINTLRLLERREEKKPSVETQ